MTTATQMKHDALRGFHCMAVYATPQTAADTATAAVADTTAPSHSSKKKKKGSKQETSASAQPSPAPSAPSTPLIRYLYYKLHTVRIGGSSAAAEDENEADESGARPGCTLFVVNIPFHYTSEHLTQLFSVFGSVSHVLFLQSHAASQLCIDVRAIGPVERSSYYRSAQVVYEEPSSATMACHTDLSQMPQQCPEEEDDELNVGMKKWISHYHSLRPDAAALQSQVDRFMAGFDARAEEERAAAKKGAAVDAEGWTLVQPSQKNKKRQMIAMEEETARAQERAAKKQKKNTQVHFYRHQQREEKKERLMQLREKFEQDKAKIAKMREQRKFKPM